MIPEKMSEMMGMGLTAPDEMMLQERHNQMMKQSGENPFDAPQYRQVQAPDAPINYGGGMAEVLLSDSEVPEPIKKRYWWVFNKDNVLTFLDETRKKNKLMAFDVAIIDTMNSMDSFDDYTFDTELQYGIVRNALEVKLDRAVGFKGGNFKNERIILQSQFSESRAINEDGNNGAVKQGFFKRLLGRR